LLFDHDGGGPPVNELAANFTPALTHGYLEVQVVVKAFIAAVEEKCLHFHCLVWPYRSFA